jgi:hypothetical protein
MRGGEGGGGGGEGAGRAPPSVGLAPLLAAWRELGCGAAGGARARRALTRAPRRRAR